MRILYVAKHGQPNTADDEGAIAYALRQLGHEVTLVQEGDDRSPRMFPADLLLFHKWENSQCLQLIDHIPSKAFWHFDRIIDWHPKRRAWMERTIPLVDVGFCTDGDYAREYNSYWCERKSVGVIGNDPPGPLVWLPQGADERVVGRGTPSPTQAVDVLCVAGTRFHGLDRISFVDDLGAFCKAEGYTFRHVEEGVYREELRDLVASAKVVVAPDTPVSDRYCSNRVWNMLGFGAFLLHPYCKSLQGMFLSQENRDRTKFSLKFYMDRKELYHLIWYYLGGIRGEEDRKETSDEGLRMVRQGHLYRHRCERLIEIVKERCDLG